MRTIPPRNPGACIAPDNSWLFLQGIETLLLRMERHCQNAKTVATYLSSHKAVDWVRFPGMGSDPMHALNKTYLRGMGGSMVVFGIKGGSDAGRKFIDRRRLFFHLANVGDAKSLATHPATTTHSQLNDEQQRAVGNKPELVRLSVGIEHIDDILEALGQALSGFTLAYETYDRMNDDRSNVVLLCLAMTETQHAAGQNTDVAGLDGRWSDEVHAGWWDGFIGPGNALYINK